MRSILLALAIPVSLGVSPALAGTVTFDGVVGMASDVPPADPNGIVGKAFLNGFWWQNTQTLRFVMTCIDPSWQRALQERVVFAFSPGWADQSAAFFGGTLYLNYQPSTILVVLPSVHFLGPLPSSPPNAGIGPTDACPVPFNGTFGYGASVDAPFTVGSAGGPIQFSVQAMIFDTATSTAYTSNAINATMQ